jgi:hypothetical protein
MGRSCATDVPHEPVLSLWEMTLNAVAVEPPTGAHCTQHPHPKRSHRRKITMLTTVRLFTILALVASAAHAQTETRNPFLVQAEAFYQGAEFEKCVERAEQGKRSASTSAEKVPFEIYAGLCLQNLDREKAAQVHFNAALTLDINAQLPPIASPKSKELFDRLRAALIAAHANDAPAETGPKAQMVVGAPAPLDLSTSSTARTATLALGLAAGVAAVLSLTLGITALQEGDIGSHADLVPQMQTFATQSNRNGIGAGVCAGLAAAAAIAALLTALISRL